AAGDSGGPAGAGRAGSHRSRHSGARRSSWAGGYWTSDGSLGREMQKGSRPASTRRPRNRPHTPAARAPVGDVGDVRVVLGGGRLGGGGRRCHQTEQELALTGEQLVGEVERQGDDVGGRGKAGAGEAVDTRKRHRGELLDGRAQRLGTAEDGRLHRLDG